MSRALARCTLLLSLTAACGAAKPDARLDATIEARDTAATSPSATNEVIRPKQKTEKAAQRNDEADMAVTSGPPIVTLPGFRMLDGGQSRVFVEVTSGKVPVNESSAPLSVTYHLGGVTVPEKVNRLSLPTAHFWSPVHRIRVVQAGDGADVIIELRAKSQHTTKMKRSPFGTRLTIDFPKLPEPEEVAEVVPIHPDRPDRRRRQADDDPWNDDVTFVARDKIGK
jgi:hypothetical protein